MNTAPRFADPTNQAPSAAGAELRADPHGIQHVRGAPPFDFMSLATPSAEDLVARSVTRHTDSNGDGSGVGRRATGFQMLTSGTVTVVTGANQTETFQGAMLPQGFAVTGEILKITSSGNVLVTW